MNLHRMHNERHLIEHPFLIYTLYQQYDKSYLHLLVVECDSAMNFFVVLFLLQRLPNIQYLFKHNNVQ